MGAGLDLTGRRQDGTEFPVDVSLAPIVNEGERLVVAAIRDVTDQRLATWPRPNWPPSCARPWTPSFRPPWKAT